MEAVAIGYVGDKLPQRAIVAKAVSDFADHDKDDRCREFACRASAAWLLAFLKKHLAPKPASTHTESPGPTRDPVPWSLFQALASKPAGSRRAAPDLEGQDGPLDLFSRDARPSVSVLHQRVENALRLRHPGAHVAWKQGPADMPAALQSACALRHAAD